MDAPLSANAEDDPREQIEAPVARGIGAAWLASCLAHDAAQTGERALSFALLRQIAGRSRAKSSNQS